MSIGKLRGNGMTQYEFMGLILYSTYFAAFEKEVRKNNESRFKKTFSLLWFFVSNLE